MDLRTAFLVVLERHSLKASALAKAAGITEAQISLFKSGQRDLEGKTLQKLLDAMTPAVRADFCSCLAEQPLSSDIDPVEVSIQKLAASPLTDDQVAKLLSIASRHLRSTSRLPVAV
jgi:transcriptional regulator with XRE-family HTH domain